MTYKILAFKGYVKNTSYPNVSREELDAKVRWMLALLKKGEIRGFNVFKEG